MTLLTKENKVASNIRKLLMYSNQVNHFDPIKQIMIGEMTRDFCSILAMLLSLVAVLMLPIFVAKLLQAGAVCCPLLQFCCPLLLQCCCPLLLLQCCCSVVVPCCSADAAHFCCSAIVGCLSVVRSFLNEKFPASFLVIFIV